MLSEQTIQYALYVIMVILGGVGEYLHLFPAGSVFSVFLLVVGHVFGVSPVVSTVAKTLQKVVAQNDAMANASTNGATIPTRSASIPEA